MTTAFVLSGGGSLGSIQVGMLLALAEAEITPDVIVGAVSDFLYAGALLALARRRADIDEVPVR